MQVSVEHQRALILKRRCAHCAESVPPAVLLRGQPCPHCGRVSTWHHESDVGALSDGVDEQWRKRRWWFYGVVAALSFATGMFPIAASLVTIMAMVYARFVLVRQSLDWFGPARRFTTRFTLRLWMLTTSLLVLISNELLTLVPWANMPLKMLVSLLGAALFVEGSLRFLRGRLKDEASQDPGLRWWEWALPAALLAGAVALSLALTATILFVVELYQGAIGWLGTWLGGVL